MLQEWETSFENCGKILAFIIIYLPHSNENFNNLNSKGNAHQLQYKTTILYLIFFDFIQFFFYTNQFCTRSWKITIIQFPYKPLRGEEVGLFNFCTFRFFWNTFFRRLDSLMAANHSKIFFFCIIFSIGGIENQFFNRIFTHY